VSVHVAGAAALALAGGCHAQNEADRRVEAGIVTHAVEALRNAPNAGKRPFLDKLEATECKALCELRDVCVRAYSLQQSALEALATARMLARASTDVVDTRTVELLKAAETNLNDSREQTKQCADAEAAARRVYRL
jgi:hypothetical protein